MDVEKTVFSLWPYLNLAINKMKKTVLLLSIVICLTSFGKKSKKIEWISTTTTKQWEVKKIDHLPGSSTDHPNVVVHMDREQQTIDGFGTCFNELGWTSLLKLSPSDRESIMRELFAPGIGANFTVCRMPIAANDFALNWYSYNETEGDFKMANFSLENDKNTLIPFIKNALKYNPELKIWASPWSPPSWMKYNKHYASASSLKQASTAENQQYQNDLPIEREGKEGTDGFIQEKKYFKSYALYFSKFIEGYRNQGIDIYAVMPQNEFNSSQVFPSSCWTAKGLSNFIGSYLGPSMKKLGVDVYFGTMERANESLVDTVLQNKKSGKYIKGVGFQWAGKNALPGINKRYPTLKMYQTEQECGDGKNDWKGAMYSWDLMKHYLNNGVSVYEYWNTSLLEGGISRWGWAQNSLIVVDEERKDYHYSLEFYLLKHASHFVLKGAKKIETGGDYSDILAFKNIDQSVVLIVGNKSNESKVVTIKVGDVIISPELNANSINTIKIQN